MGTYNYGLAGVYVFGSRKHLVVDNSTGQLIAWAVILLWF